MKSPKKRATNRGAGGKFPQGSPPRAAEIIDDPAPDDALAPFVGVTRDFEMQKILYTELRESREKAIHAIEEAGCPMLPLMGRLLGMSVIYTKPYKTGNGPTIRTKHLDLLKRQIRAVRQAIERFGQEVLTGAYRAEGSEAHQVRVLAFPRQLDELIESLSALFNMERREPFGREATYHAMCEASLVAYVRRCTRRPFYAALAELLEETTQRYGTYSWSDARVVFDEDTLRARVRRYESNKKVACAKAAANTKKARIPPS